MGSCFFFRLDAEMQAEVFERLDLQDRARLACVDRAFRRACAAHATTVLRRPTELVVPWNAWEQYVGGVERCLVQHAAALRTVHVHFESRKVAQPGWEHDDSASDSSDSSFERVRNTDWNSIDQQTRSRLAERVWAWQAAREDDLQQRARAQAEALPRLCHPLRLAEGLRELVLGVHGRAGIAVPDRLSSLGRLTQLRALQLNDVVVYVEEQNFIAGLSPLMRLTRLGVQFATNSERHDTIPYVRDGATQFPFPWADAIGGLIHLQELRMTTSSDNHSCRDMFRGKLPAALSQLTALRHLEVLGMSEAWRSRDNVSHLQLAALPALETAALRLRQCETGQFESLRRGQSADLYRLVSLSLTLRVDDANEYEKYKDTHLPTIIAPALTELILDNIKLAPDSEQLSWLPGLPKLRRLALANLQLASDQLPQGIAACSSLTELALRRIGDARPTRSEPGDYIYSDDYDSDNPRPAERLLRALPDGPYLINLVGLSLYGNAFDAVPLALAAATALELLDLAHQDVPVADADSAGDAPASVQGLHVLDVLSRLRRVILEGFEQDDDCVRFQAAHPHVDVCI